ncbi:MAG TPA: S41 family peptidase [Gemmatimonadales bacterium]
MLRTVFAALVLVSAVSAPAPAQRQQSGVPAQLRSRGHRMLEQIRETLEQHYFDSTFHGVDMAAAFVRADSAIDTAASPAELMAAIAAYVGTLNDTHTAFSPPALNVRVRYGWSPRMVGVECFVADVTEGSDAAAKGLAVGDRVLAIDGIRPTRENLGVIFYVYYRLSPRPGMRLVVQRPDGTQEEMIVDAEMERRPPVTDLTDNSQIHFYLESVRGENHPVHHTVVLGDSVMVWRMHGFVSGKGASRTTSGIHGNYDHFIDEIMAEARKYPHLVLDLRGNGGGLVASQLRLLGHFVGERTLELTEHRRDTVIDRYIDPVSDRPYAGSVTVLIDSESASAAELTTRLLQRSGKATVVGDRSMGAVVMASYHSLATGGSGRRMEYGLNVTMSELILPGGENLEHQGVTPNIALLPTPSDYRDKRDPALAFALELLGINLDPAAAFTLFDGDN